MLGSYNGLKAHLKCSYWGTEELQKELGYDYFTCDVETLKFICCKKEAKKELILPSSSLLKKYKSSNKSLVRRRPDFRGSAHDVPVHDDEEGELYLKCKPQKKRTSVKLYLVGRNQQYKSFRLLYITPQATWQLYFVRKLPTKVQTDMTAKTSYIETKRRRPFLSKYKYYNYDFTCGLWIF